MSSPINRTQRGKFVPPSSPKRLKQIELPANTAPRFTPPSPMEPQGLWLSRNIPDFVRIEVVGAGGRIEHLAAAVAKEQLRDGDLSYARDKATGREYIVMKEAYEEHARNVYEYQSIVAIKEIETRLAAVPELKFKREIFFKIESKVLDKSSPKNIRHLSFILQESAENGGDYITAIGLLLHNVERGVAARMLKQARGKTAGMEWVTEEILNAIDRFRELNEIMCCPPEKREDYSIHDNIDAHIKIARGNWRALVMLLAHKLSSLSMKPDDANDIEIRSIRELYSPLARRFGRIHLDSKLRNEAFRLNEADRASRLKVTDRYQEIEKGIIQTLDMSRAQAERYLIDLEEKIKLVFEASEGGYAFSASGVKTPESVREKSERKKEIYPEIFMMEDLLRATVVTQRTMTLADARDAVQLAVGREEFSRFDAKQTETKEYDVGDAKVFVHHLGIVLKKGNSLEIQVMDKKGYELLEHGYRAHWIYKLENISGQKFDHALIELCSRNMNGEIAHDIGIVYQALTQWTYVFLKEGDHIRALRTMNGSLPLDIFARINDGDIRDYGGAKIGKIWKKKQMKNADESAVLKDGDLIEFKPADGKYQEELSRLNLEPAYADTRIALFKNKEE